MSQLIIDLIVNAILCLLLFPLLLLLMAWMKGLYRAHVNRRLVRNVSRASAAFTGMTRSAARNLQ
jgi:hypothetical protein